jgi:hypothetical protein
MINRRNKCIKKIFSSNEISKIGFIKVRFWNDIIANYNVEFVNELLVYFQKLPCFWLQK